MLSITFEAIKNGDYVGMVKLAQHLAFTQKALNKHGVIESQMGLEPLYNDVATGLLVDSLEDFAMTTRGDKISKLCNDRPVTPQKPNSTDIAATIFFRH